MNTPALKYADISTCKELLFFNYHEFLVHEYAPLITTESNRLGDQEAQATSEVLANDNSTLALVINNFPNPYTFNSKELFRSTRIIRIPRVYDSCAESYVIPQFSTYSPGSEPAAIKNEKTKQYQPYGSYKGYNFGTSSLTPLVPLWLSESEYLDIVQSINKLLWEAYTPRSGIAALENALDFFTGAFYSTVISKYFSSSNLNRKLAKVDAYVRSINGSLRIKHPFLQLMDPLKSAMLSLDFQVPMEAEDQCSIRRHGSSKQLESEGSHSTAPDQQR